jgi:hypothetical protein
MGSILLALLLSTGQLPKGPASCIDTPVLISDLALTTTRTAAYNGPNNIGWTYGWLYVELTDGDTSITQLNVSCTVSTNGNTSDFTPQKCSTSSTDGSCTLIPVTGWIKASPGTSKFPIPFNMRGAPDFECPFSVGAGAGGAGDILRVTARLCAE